MKASIIPIIVFVWTIAADILIYVCAKALGQLPYFETITNTSDNFPGYIIFRSLMIPMVPLMQLSFYLEYLRISKLSKLHSNSEVEISTWYLWLGQIGCFNGIWAVATIDTGKMNGTLHALTAGIFFGFITITTFLCTYNLEKMKRYNGNLVNTTSY